MWPKCSKPRGSSGSVRGVAGYSLALSPGFSSGAKSRIPSIGPRRSPRRGCLSGAKKLNDSRHLAIAGGSRRAFGRLTRVRGGTLPWHPRAPRRRPSVGGQGEGVSGGAGLATALWSALPMGRRGGRRGRVWAAARVVPAAIVDRDAEASPRHRGPGPKRGTGASPLRGVNGAAVGTALSTCL